MKSRIFSSRNLKTVLKGQMWIPVFTLIAFAMAFPVAELLMIGNWEGLRYDFPERMAMLYENLWKDGLVITGTIVSVFVGIINAVSGYWYLYSRRKTDFYHSLPLKRRQMFGQKTVTAVVVFLVPYVIMEFMGICVGAMRGFFNLKLMGMAVQMLVFHLLVFLLVYFCTVLVICMTGNVLMGMLSMGAVAFYGPMLGILVQKYSEWFFRTYSSVDSALTRTLIYRLSPALGIIRLGQKYGDEGLGMIQCLGLLLAGLLVGAGAFFAFEKRPVENAGKALVFRWSEIVIRFMMVIPSGLGIGMIFYWLPGDGTNLIWGICGLMGGTVLVHGMMEVLYTLDFRQFFSHGLQLLLSGVLVVFAVVSFKMDIMGYDSYLPDYDKIQSIGADLSGLSNYESCDTVTRDEEGYYHVRRKEFSGEAVYENEVITPNTQLYEELENLVAGSEKWYKNNKASIPVKYILKSGRSVCRRYPADGEQIRKFMEAAYMDKNLIDEKYSFLQIEDKYLSGASVELCDGSTIGFTWEDVKKFTEALRADVAEADAQTITENPCALVYFSYLNLSSAGYDKNIHPWDDIMNGYSCSTYIYPGFKRTVAFLEEKGYPLSMDEISVEYIEVGYDGDSDSDGIIDSIWKVYYDEQAEELKSAVTVSALAPEWVNHEYAYANIKIDGDENYIYNMQLLTDKVPDFVKEDMQKAKEGTLESNPAPEEESEWKDEDENEENVPMVQSVG